LWMVVLLLPENPVFAQTSLQKVTLRYSSSGITSIEFFIAREKKFFQEEGLEPLACGSFQCVRLYDSTRSQQGARDQVARPLSA
jgi:hypothetical protein